MGFPRQRRPGRGVAEIKSWEIGQVEAGTEGDALGASVAQPWSPGQWSSPSPRPLAAFLHPPQGRWRCPELACVCWEIKTWTTEQAFLLKEQALLLER